MNGLPLPDRARWLLEACLRDDGRAIEAFGKWRRFADPDRMEGRELRLTPLLHENMRRLGLSDQRLAWIGGQAKHIWLTGVLRRRKLRSVLDLLEGAGVDFVLIKGAAMGARFPKAVGNSAHGRFRPAHSPVFGARGYREPQCVWLARSDRGGVLGRRLKPLSRCRHVGLERDRRRSPLAAGRVDRNSSARGRGAGARGGGQP